MTELTASRFEVSDLLSPLVVKELRQGLRGQLFQVMFLLLQLVLLSLTVGTIIMQSSIPGGADTQWVTGIFWFIVGIPLIALIPLMGGTAIRKEIDNKGMELVYLTHLTPWRIVAGKWAALSAQSLLFVFSLLPYFVLRYFLGGIDLLQELLILLALLGCCLLLTSITVSLSAFPKWVMIVASVLAFWIIPTLAAPLLALIGFGGLGMMTAGIGGGGMDTNPYILLPVFGLLALLLILEMGASTISPPGAKRSFSIRLIGLAALGIATLLHFAGTQSGMALATALPILFIVCLGAICETPRWIPSLYHSFSRHGTFGRLLGRFLLYPGWPSGIIYGTVVAAVFIAIPSTSGAYDPEEIFFFLGFYTSGVFAVALTRLFWPKTAVGFRIFIIIQAAMFLLSLFYISLKNLMKIQVPTFAAFPPTTLLMSAWTDTVSDGPVIYNSILVFVLAGSLAILLFRGIPLIPRFRHMESLEPKKTPPTA